MNQTDLMHNLVQALDVIHSPQSTNQDRHQAQLTCDSVKESNASVEIGLLLCSHEYRPHPLLRHFGLGLVEHSVRYRWDSFFVNHEQIQALKDAMSNLIINELNEDDPIFIVEKSIRVYVEVAKRIWPGLWLDMDLSLRNVSTSGHFGFRLVLHIYRTLAEDIFVLDDAAAGVRKRELSTGMTCVISSSAVLNQLHEKLVGTDGTTMNQSATDVTLLLQHLRANPENEGWLTRWIQVLSQTYSAPEQTREFSLCDVILKTLPAILIWVGLASIRESNAILVILKVLSHPDETLRTSATECLSSIFGRNIQPTDQERMSCIWRPIFEETGLDFMINVWLQLHSASTANEIHNKYHTALLDESVYPMIRSFAETLYLLGSCQILFKRNTSTPPHFDRFLELMLIVADHPSVTISLNAYAFFVELLRHERLSKDCVFEKMIPLLLTKIVIRLQKIQLSSAEKHYSELEYENGEEMQKEAQIWRSQAVSILKQLSARFPVGVVTVLVQESLSQLNHPLTAAAVLIPSFVNTLNLMRIKSDPTADDIHILGKLRELLVAVIQQPSTSKSMIDVQLDIITGTSLVLECFPDLLTAAIEKTFILVTYSIEGENIQSNTRSPPSSDVRAVRRKAGSTLVRIGQHVANALTPYLETIMQSVTQLADSPRIRRLERNLLIEFLLTLLTHNSSMSENDKVQGFSRVLDMDIQQLNTLQLKLTSVDDFQAFTGVKWLLENAPQSSVDRGTTEHLDLLYSQRSMLSIIIQGIAVYMKRTAGVSYWKSLLPRYVAFVLKQIGFLHTFWKVGSTHTFPAHIKKIFSLTKGEKLSLLTGSARDEEGAEGNTAITSYEQELNDIWHWLGHFRQICYSALRVTIESNSSTFNFWDPSICELHLIFVEADAIDIFHWKSLFSLTSSILFHCPTPHVDRHIQQFLGPLIQLITAKLDFVRGICETLNESEAYDNTIDFAENTHSISEEVLQQRLCRDFSRTFAQLLLTLTTPSRKAAENGTTEQNQFQYDTIVSSAFSNNDVSVVIFTAVFALCRIKDTVTCRRGLNSLQRLLLLLPNYPHLLNTFAKDAFALAIQVLCEGYHKECHQDAIHLLCEIYTAVRPLTTDAVEILASMDKVDVSVVKAFDEEFGKKTTMKEKYHLMKQLLASMTGAEASQVFSRQTSFVSNTLEKNLFKWKRDSHHADIVDVENVDPVLSNLFENQ